MSEESQVRKRQVFVLGAGFSKSFHPSAPLVIDKWPIGEILEQVPAAGQFFRKAWLQSDDLKLNLETLLTRAHMGMPYDKPGTEYVRGQLFGKLVQILSDRIGLGPAHYQDDLREFAKFCIENEASCISFNYDDFLDVELFRASEVDIEAGEPRVGWHPSSGYGYACASSIGLLNMETLFGGPFDSKVSLLKLHGSLNWRVKYGHEPPYSLQDVVHHSNWYKVAGDASTSRHWRQLEDLLNPEPLIVPPILLKDGIQLHPVIRRVWSSARQRLFEAEEITFIGYSLPLTDIAAQFLFSESLNQHQKIRVVCLAQEDPQKQEIRSKYLSLLPWKRRREGDDSIESMFHFEDARAWILKLIQKERGA